MVKLQTLSALLILLLIIGCSSVKTFSDYNQSVDFTRIASYKWADSEKADKSNPLIDTDLIDSRIKNAVNNEMSKRGVSIKQNESTDVYLVYHILLEDKVTVDTYDPYWGYRWYYRGFGVPTYASVDQYVEGTLIIAMHDINTNETLWRAWAVGTVQPGKSGTEEKINSVVAEIMKKYPVEAE